MKHRAFTLIEMLVATTLSAVLIYAVLQILGGVSRDRRLVSRLTTVPSAGVINLFQWDLANAETIGQASGAEGMVLIGHNGIDRATLLPNGRLVQATYRLQHTSAGNTLWRQQEYLDDPVKPDPWWDLVAGGVTEISITSPSGGASLSLMPSDTAIVRRPPPEQTVLATRVPSHLHLHVAMDVAGIDQEIWIK